MRNSNQPLHVDNEPILQKNNLTNLRATAINLQPSDKLEQIEQFNNSEQYKLA